MLDTITWKEDNQFGYFVAEDVPGIDNEDLLQPQNFYRKQKREAEYETIAKQILDDRIEYINQFDGLYPHIKKAI
jgi:ATP-dependent phosphoenolpyruvate carboxykinase